MRETGNVNSKGQTGAVVSDREEEGDRNECLRSVVHPERGLLYRCQMKQVSANLGIVPDGQS